MIVANELRAALASWSDRLVAASVVVGAVVAVRSALAHRPFLFALGAVAALAAAIGFAAARIIERRLDFHAQDGVLAADALAHDSLRHYALPIHGLFATTITAFIAIGRPSAAMFAPLGYCIGAGICHIAWGTSLGQSSTRRSSTSRFTTRLLQPRFAGAMAGIVAALPLVFHTSIGGELPVVGVSCAFFALILTTLDHSVVRFMTECGYSALRVVRTHARPLLTFLLLALVAALVASNTSAAIVVCGVVLAALVLMTARIFAYRTYPKRAADTLLSICGIIVLAAVSLPIMLPVLVVVIMWQLYRRAASTTWLLR